MTGDLVEFLCSTNLFRSVDRPLVAQLTPDLEIISLSDEEVLVREGDADQNLYLVVAGSLRVRGRNQQNELVLLSAAGPGESAGEMGVLADDPSSTMIDAAGQTRVIRVPRTVFDQFSATHPAAALLVTQSLSQILQRNRVSLALHFSSLFASLAPDVLRDLEL